LISEVFDGILKVENVSILGGGQLPYAHEFGILTVKLPDELPTEYANCLEVSYGK
jgi:alpha-L-fucosidase